MNKNFKVVQIHGLSGLLILGLLVTGLFCGFMIFPIWVVMISWNALAHEFGNCPTINYTQAMMLWLIVILSLYLFFKNSISIKFEKGESLDPANIEDIVNEIKEKEENNK